MFVFTDNTIKQEYAKIFIKDICIYLQYFKAISAKISEHYEANPRFNSGPQWSRQAVGTCSSGSGRYLRWMESPPINLSGCDWTPVMINLFSKT